MRLTKHLFVLLAVLMSLPSLANSLKPFKITFDLYYGWWYLGTASYQLKEEKNESYDFTFNSKMRFLIYTDKREVVSRFAYDNDKEKMLPLLYQHQREGTGTDYEEQIVFDSHQGLISANFFEHNKRVRYDELVKDGLLVQLQLMQDLKAGRRPLQYTVFETIGLVDREFKVLGEEKLEIDDRTYTALKIEVDRPEKGLKTLMWFARELDYLPILLEHYSDGKKKFNAKIAKFSL